MGDLIGCYEIPDTDDSVRRTEPCGFGKTPFFHVNYKEVICNALVLFIGEIHTLRDVKVQAVAILAGLSIDPAVQTFFAHHHLQQRNHRYEGQGQESGDNQRAYHHEDNTRPLRPNVLKQPSKGVHSIATCHWPKTRKLTELRLLVKS